MTMGTACWQQVITTGQQGTCGAEAGCKCASVSAQAKHSHVSLYVSSVCCIVQGSTAVCRCLLDVLHNALPVTVQHTVSVGKQQ